MKSPAFRKTTDNDVSSCVLKNHESKTIKRPRTYRSLTKRILLLALALWMTAMGLLTWIAAEDMYRQVEDATRSYVLRSYSYGRARYLDADSMKLPGAMERQCLIFFTEVTLKYIPMT